MPIYYPVDRIPSKWEKKNKVAPGNKKRRHSPPSLPSFNLHAFIKWHKGVIMAPAYSTNIEQRELTDYV